MERPIILYLDTQDYSRFADCFAGRGSTHAEEVLEALLPMIQSGQVVCPISMVHVSELLQYEDGGHQLTYRKAETIEKLCWPNAFADFNSLIEREIIEFAYHQKVIKHLPSKPSPHFPLRSDGMWLSGPTGSLSDFGKEIENYLSENMKKDNQISRQQRRQLMADFKKNGIHEVAAELKKNNAICGIDKNNTLTKRMKDKDLFAELLMGRVAASEVEMELYHGLFQPTNYVKWFFGDDNEDKTPHYLARSVGIQLQRDMEKMRQQLTVAPAPSWKQTIHDLSANIFDNAFPDVADKLRKLGGSSAKIEALSKSESRRDIPATSFLTTLFVHMMKRHEKNTPNSPKIKFSDAGDIMHSIYMPHSDIWRGDAATAELLRQTFPALSGKVVGKLQDLPAALRRSIECRPSTASGPSGRA